MSDARYELPDPELRAYDHGVGTLSVDGELRGHLACVVGQLRGGDPWPWFVIIWADGSKEFAFEDYGPGWYTVRELDAGFLEHCGPSTVKSRRFLGLRYERIDSGEPVVYDFAWLPADVAARRWQELGFRDSDF